MRRRLRRATATLFSWGSFYHRRMYIDRYRQMNLTLSFRNEAESEFLDRFFDRSISQMRFALILGIILYAAFGLLDAIAAPAAKTPMWIIRYAIVCPLFAFGWALTYTSFFRR